MALRKQDLLDLVAAAIQARIAVLIAAEEAIPLVQQTWMEKVSFYSGSALSVTGGLKVKVGRVD